MQSGGNTYLLYIPYILFQLKLPPFRLFKWKMKLAGKK